MVYAPARQISDVMQPAGAVLFCELSRHQGNLADSPILAVSDHDAEVARVTIVTSQIGRNFPGRCECMTE